MLESSGAPQQKRDSLGNNKEFQDMADDNPFGNRELPPHESGVRRMIGDETGAGYVAFSSLAAAQADPDGIVVLEGDDGGQIYVVARAATVHCPEHTLLQLLQDLDALEWNDLSMARVHFERSPVGSGVAGGMGGAVSPTGLWVHERLKYLEPRIENVLTGQQSRIG